MGMSLNSLKIFRMEDSIVAISKDPLDVSCINLKSAKQSFFVCEAALESIIPVLEQHGIRAGRQFKVVSAQTVRKMTACGIGMGTPGKIIVLTVSVNIPSIRWSVPIWC